MTVYTRSHSIMALVVPASSGAKTRTKAAAKMPLSLIEFTCSINPAETLHRPSALAIRKPFHSLYFHPVKSAMGLFIAEFLAKLLRETPPDATLFSYIEGALLYLDSLKENMANFHLTFLSSLTTFLGIAPDIENPTAIFDMRAGRYVNILPGHPDVLLGNDAKLPQLLSRLNYANMQRLRLSRSQRNQILENILHYYSIHLPSVGRLNTLDVLTQLFD